MLVEQSSRHPVNGVTVLVCRLGDVLNEAVALQQLHQT